MKVFFSHWVGPQKRSLDKRGAKRRLISFADIKEASGRQARQAAKEYGFLKTPKTVVAVNGLKGKRKKTSGPKSRRK